MTSSLAASIQQGQLFKTKQLQYCTLCKIAHYTHHKINRSMIDDLFGEIDIPYFFREQFVSEKTIYCEECGYHLNEYNDQYIDELCGYVCEYHK